MVDLVSQQIEEAIYLKKRVSLQDDTNFFSETADVNNRLSF